jgi:DNA mismatch endonuclease, patch repair protein
VDDERKIYGLERLRDTLEVSEPTAKSMRANRGTETSPEVNLRRELWAAGLRGYRKNVSQLPGAPDVVFGPSRVCVFVHGCFWHGCERCSRNLKPRKNAAYWEAKIARNRERDRRNEEALAADGWLVLTIWECELKDSLSTFVERVREAVESRRGPHG